MSPGRPGANTSTARARLMAIPLFDQGRRHEHGRPPAEEPAAFDREGFPEWVWLSNLFGRATHNLVLAEELRKAYDLVDRELKVVADIQRSLLPTVMPDDPRARPGRALPDVAVGRRRLLRLLRAARRPLGHPDRRRQRPRHPRRRHDGDHCTASPTAARPARPAGELLKHVNEHLATRYTTEARRSSPPSTASIDPAARADLRQRRPQPAAAEALRGRLDAGARRRAATPPRRLRRPGLPAGTLRARARATRSSSTPTGSPRPRPRRRDVRPRRLDEALENCHLDAQGLIETVLATLKEFTGGLPPSDDQTVVVAKVL